MADDTRQPKEDLSREALNVHPENKAFTGTQWQGGKQVPYKPPENANVLDGGTENTAGGKTLDYTVKNAFREGIGLKDFTEVPKRPCVRDAYMTGIAGGFVVGGVRAIWGAAVFKACSWAVGSFCIGSFVQYQYCYYQRHAEADGMKRAIEIMNRKDVEKKAREARKDKVRAERREAKDKEQDAQLSALKESKEGGGKPWWKVW